MFKGTNASAGIGIGKAAIIKEVEMVIRPDKVASVETEVTRFRGRWQTRWLRQRLWKRLLPPE